MHHCVSAKHRLSPCSMTISRVHVDFSALHEDMDRTFDEAVNPKRAQLVRVKGHVTTLARTHLEPFVEISGYGESVRFDCVVVDYMNCNIPSKCNIHHRP